MSSLLAAVAPYKMSLYSCHEVWGSKHHTRTPPHATVGAKEAGCQHHDKNLHNACCLSTLSSRAEFKGRTTWDKAASAKICGFLKKKKKTAVSCGFFERSAVSCGFMRKSASPKCYISQQKRKSARKICEKTANSAPVVPFSLSLLIPLDLRSLGKGPRLSRSSWADNSCSPSHLTPNMTGRRFHRIMEAIPRRPWKSKIPFAPRPIKTSINKGTQGYDAVLPPFISVVRSPVVQSNSSPSHVPFASRFGHF